MELRLISSMFRLWRGEEDAQAEAYTQGWVQDPVIRCIVHCIGQPVAKEQTLVHQTLEWKIANKMTFKS